MQWYYAVGDQRQGPIEQAEFERLVAAGTIQAGTLVWRQGMADWQPYSAVGGGGAAAPAVDDGTEVCAVSGKRYPRREMVQYEGKWISAEHRDAYFQRLREGVGQPGDGAVPGPYGYGGFWRRFVARIVDSIIMGFVGGFIGGLIGGLFGATMGIGRGARPGQIGMFIAVQALIILLSLGLGIAYEVFFIRKFDATPGKMAMGVKILRSDGSKLSVGRILGRYFANWLNGFTLLIGYIIAAFDEEKRALHDRICDTRVIKTR